VTAVHKEPDYSTTAPFFGDIAVVDLAADAPATPLAYARTAPTAADVGTSVRIVGYGETVDDVNSEKKTAATTVIASLDGGSDGSDTMTVGDGSNHTCVGDSGGPAINSAGVVLGVDSYTDTSGCTGPSHFRRTDAFLTFIDAAIADGSGTGTGSGSGSDGDSGGGGCDAGSSGGAGLVFAAAGLLVTRRRRAAL
jgi:hypothetical protein